MKPTRCPQGRISRFTSRNLASGVDAIVDALSNSTLDKFLYRTEPGKVMLRAHLNAIFDLAHARNIDWSNYAQVQNVLQIRPDPGNGHNILLSLVDWRQAFGDTETASVHVIALFRRLQPTLAWEFRHHFYFEELQDLYNSFRRLERIASAEASLFDPAQAERISTLADAFERLIWDMQEAIVLGRLDALAKAAKVQPPSLGELEEFVELADAINHGPFEDMLDAMMDSALFDAAYSVESGVRTVLYGHTSRYGLSLKTLSDFIAWGGPASRFTTYDALIFINRKHASTNDLVRMLAGFLRGTDRTSDGQEVIANIDDRLAFLVGIRADAAAIIDYLELIKSRAATSFTSTDKVEKTVREIQVGIDELTKVINAIGAVMQ